MTFLVYFLETYKTVFQVTQVKKTKNEVLKCVDDRGWFTVQLQYVHSTEYICIQIHTARNLSSREDRAETSCVVWIYALHILDSAKASTYGAFQ